MTESEERRAWLARELAERTSRFGDGVAAELIVDVLPRVAWLAAEDRAGVLEAVLGLRAEQRAARLQASYDAAAREAGGVDGI